MSFANRHVVLGVTGGIAAYKSCTLLRRLVEAGARVDVILTHGAMEFVRPLTFEALSGRPVLTDLWAPDAALSHVRLGQDADLIVVAPATAHLIARLAHGQADDLLTSLLLARTAPLLVAPAMNDAMYAAPPTQVNLATLRAHGVHLVGPEVGPLAEGPSDRPGRMSEPGTILDHAARLLHGAGPLSGLRVVVTAGATREALDPVRVVTNRSSGKMGFRLAEAAWQRGADVHLITGPSAEPAPTGVTLERITTTADLQAAVASALPSADVLIMAAAPADYRPARSADRKRPRSEGTLRVDFEPTEDILLSTREARKPGAVIVGFALETGDAVSKGRAKLERKDLDIIVINDALEPGAGFDVETNRVTLVDRTGRVTEVPLASKSEVAHAILATVEGRLAR